MSKFRKVTSREGAPNDLEQFMVDRKVARKLHIESNAIHNEKRKCNSRAKHVVGSHTVSSQSSLVSFITIKMMTDTKTV